MQKGRPLTPPTSRTFIPVSTCCRFRPTETGTLIPGGPGSWHATKFRPTETGKPKAAPYGLRSVINATLLQKTPACPLPGGLASPKLFPSPVRRIKYHFQHNFLRFLISLKKNYIFYSLLVKQISNCNGVTTGQTPRKTSNFYNIDTFFTAMTESTNKYVPLDGYLK